MAIVDLFAGLVSGPASRVVEAPVRELVDEILRQQDIARPHEVAQLKREIQSLGKELEGLEAKLAVVQRFPAFELAGEAREVLGNVQPAVGRKSRSHGLSKSDGFYLTACTDELHGRQPSMRLSLRRGRMRRARFGRRRRPARDGFRWIS